MRILEITKPNCSEYNFAKSFRFIPNFIPAPPFLSEMRTKVFWLTMFAIAFGFVESSVVVYLRKIYYDSQTVLFPLKSFEPGIFATELLHEASTLIMLLAVPFSVFSKKLLRFAGFLWCFAVWDIFYYVFLKFLIGWPSSIMEWDILFLLPTVWVSPVLAPVICSVSMMILAFIIFYFDEKTEPVRMSRRQLWLLIAGSFLVLTSFMQDYMGLAFSTPPGQFQDAVSLFVPEKFNWLLFTCGESLILYGVCDLLVMLQKSRKFFRVA